MPAATIAYAKNTIRRAFREVVESSPSKSQIADLWSYFESTCVYCGKILDRKNKDGHVDHLVPASKGGLNHISNRVLSCATCNSDEKLDRPWEEFLLLKNADPEIFSERKAKIVEWKSRVQPPESQLLALAEQAAAKVFACIDAEVEELRRKVLLSASHT